MQKAKAIPPSTFFPSKKGTNKKTPTCCFQLFVYLFSSRKPLMEMNSQLWRIGIEVGLQVVLGLNFLPTFLGVVEFSTPPPTHSKPPADRTCVRTSFVPTLIGVTRVVGARPVLVGVENSWVLPGKTRLGWVQGLFCLKTKDFDVGRWWSQLLSWGWK